MKRRFFLQLGFIHGCLLACVSAQPASTSVNEKASTQVMTIPVDSKAFVFSPGNWVGDKGRAGKEFRQTWNPGAYFRISWSSANPKPSAKLMLDTSGYTPVINPPRISYNLDGIWKVDVSCEREIILENIDTRRQLHELTVILSSSWQQERWGTQGVSGTNVLRVNGLQVDADGQPIPATPAQKWALIVGDSITEGQGAGALGSYSHLLGQALTTQGYEYAISACGYSGWLARGDKSPGDVPAYYNITGSVNGAGGTYHDAESRWNKIDGNGHSLLDVKGRISAYGQTGQEPALIFINYGTNDAAPGKFNPSDLKASINQGLAALRKSAPDAQIIVLIPFGQYCAAMLKEAVELRQKASPADAKIAFIDLGPGVARSLTQPPGMAQSSGKKDGAKFRVFGDLHPSALGCANFSALLIPQVMNILNAGQNR